MADICKLWILLGIDIQVYRGKSTTAALLSRRILNNLITCFLKKLENGFDYLKIYNGGTDYSNQIAELTGTYHKEKVSIPRNQMFIVFETNDAITKKGFKALIHEHSILYNYF